MTIILSKIWYLGGWFYILLFVLVLISWFGSRRTKKLIGNLVVIAAAVFAVYFTFKQFIKIGVDLKAFSDPLEVKLDRTTYGQYSYALHLQGILPADESGCILWSFDLATYYLQKELYPRHFRVAREVSENCKFVVTQFSPITVEGLTLIDTFEGNYLYGAN